MPKPYLRLNMVKLNAACRAMGGTVLFQDALAERLGVMHPSRDDMQRFLDGHPPQVRAGLVQ